MDFANGVYFDGTTTSADPTAFVNNGAVTAGVGLVCNATNITAKGALLSAFQGASGYSTQIAMVGAAAASGANVGMLSDDHTNGIFMNGTAAGFLTFNNGASSGLQDSAGLDWTHTCWGCVQNAGSGSTRRLSSLGPGASTTGATGAHLADTNGYAAPGAIFLGSWNNGFTFGGEIAQLAVFKNNIFADKVIPPAAFAGANGWWWNGDIANAKIAYGNVLQYDYTQPWTVIAAFCCLNAAGGGHNGVSGILFTNVTAGAPFPGYEFWIDGNGNLTVRIISNANTNLIDVHGGTNVADGKWHVGVATNNGSGLASGVQIYLDGVAETLTAVADTLGGNSIVSAGQNYLIGNQQNQPNFAMEGAIGLFRQFNAVKPLSYIQQYKINQLLPAVDSSCVLAPKLSEGGSNTTTGDLSSSGLTGTLNSAGCWLRG